MQAHAVAPVRPGGPSDRRLTEILTRCAAGDPTCLAELESHCGHQIQTTPERALGDRAVASFAMPAVLADLRDRAGAFDPTRHLAEDWVFGVVRGRLSELVRASQRLSSHQPATVRTGSSEPRAPPPRRRWLRALLLATGLPIVALAAFVLLRPRLEPAPLDVLAPAAPPAPRRVEAPVAPPEPPDAEGTAVPQEPDTGTTIPVPTTRPMGRREHAAAVLPVTSSVRVFIHFTQADPPARRAAERLAGHLRRDGIVVVALRPVPFEIGALSVRYFFAADREAATRMAGSLPDLAGPPARVADFTHYAPKPLAGTIEIWLPAS